MFLYLITISIHVWFSVASSYVNGLEVVSDTNETCEVIMNVHECDLGVCGKDCARLYNGVARCAWADRYICLCDFPC